MDMRMLASASWENIDMDTFNKIFSKLSEEQLLADGETFLGGRIIVITKNDDEINYVEPSAQLFASNLSIIFKHTDEVFKLIYDIIQSPPHCRSIRHRRLTGDFEYIYV